MFKSFLAKIFKHKDARPWTNRDIRIRPELSPYSQKVEFFLGAKPLDLVNVSKAGLALTKKTLVEIASNESAIHTKFLDQEVDIELMHQARDIVGFKIHSDFFSNWFIQNYEVELMAASLARVRDENVKQDPRGKTFWWNNGEVLDLFMVYENSHLSYLKLMVDGKLFITADGQPLNKGTIELEEGRFKSYDGSQIIKNLEELNKGDKELLHRFFTYIPDMPEDSRPAILKLIN